VLDAERPYVKLYDLRGDMLKLLLLLLALSMSIRAEPLAVIGDSITSDPNSWANVLDDGGQDTYIMAQAGRTILGYQPPRDLSATTHYDTIIYFLGSVDILERTHRLKAGLALRQHLSFFQERKFTVIVILPPIFPQRRLGSTAFRAMIVSVCEEKNIPYIDINEVWDIGWTTDGRHPSEYGHTILADYIATKLRRAEWLRN
jgi:hypothetical protein